MVLDVAKGILDVVKSLFGLSDQLRASNRQRREDMAKLFESISDCLAATSAEIRAGQVPHGRCGELITYAEALPAAIAKEAGEARAKDLGNRLHSAYGVEQLAIELTNVPDKEPHLAVLEEASGKFKALGNLVRAGSR
jgi:hypothetical protein